MAACARAASGRRSVLRSQAGRPGPAQPAEGDHDFQDDTRVAALAPAPASRAASGVARPAREAMPGEHRVGEVGHGPDGLGLDARVGVGPGQLQEFIDRGRSARAGQDPDGMQTPPHADAGPTDRVAHGGEPLGPPPFEAALGLAPLVVALRLEPGDLRPPMPSP